MTADSLSFRRIQGCGNTFVVLSDLHKLGFDWSKIAAKLLHPGFAAGGDGLMVLSPGDTDHDFEIKMYNPDGSLMGMCGNGIRCVTRFAVVEGLVPKNKSEISFIVEGRTLICEYDPITEAREVTVDMGIPSFDPAKIPLASKEPFIQQKIKVQDREFLATAVSMGNPHCVIFTDNIDALDLSNLGPQIEHHVLFPKRTNVEFVERITENHLRLRVWERGAGITLACGTGACATVAAGVTNGFCTNRARVDLPGGTLNIEWKGPGEHIRMTGPAREVFHASFSKEFIQSL